MEHEVKDHALKAIKVWNNPRMRFFEKLKEIAIEVAIIVFAITLSIWLHDKSEHSHQQKEVKDFLLGLREDLTNDIKEMQEDSQTFINTGAAFNYITSLHDSSSVNSDSVKLYQRYVFNTTGLIPNNGRYEGFKSSGRLGNIEENQLQNDITDLYQEIIPSLLASTNAYTERKQLLFDFFYKNARPDTNGPGYLVSFFSKPEAQNICQSLKFTDEIISRYAKAIDQSQKIITQINQQYQ